MNAMNEKDLSYVAKTCEAQLFQAKNVMEMVAEGMTVPFISRYRKEKTGNLDEFKVQQVNEAYDYLKELNDLKETVLKTIDRQGQLTDELKKKIEETYSKTELEDIYLPYKPKRRTKATAAKEKGLEPLALSILDETVTGTPEELAGRFVQALSTHEFPSLGPEARGVLTISGGLATYPWDGQDCRELLRCADAGLREAKTSGKNAIHLVGRGPMG